ncbi:PHD finger protein MALE STERILITY 1-like [Pistacia vera]|uniref:PHD finger protein MALE STERILITY 1-like n=1 Tax=Pistacia vera TaxID=55513 RepID=UPI00126385DB|nr:PHD finger protein MALE STERILITY 1-like [Pistacia vera]
MECKKRKRGERVFRFKSFGEHGYPIEFDGPFRHNVKMLLELGNSETNLCNGLASWSFQLEVRRHPPLHTLLFVVEEPMGASTQHHCKHCRYVGWGHHMVCNKKYHFILPSKNMVAALLSCEGDNDAGKSNLVELHSHILHVVFHSNGFGHLLCVNGVEMGSDLTGYQIMDFLDRLCTALLARKVSLCDTSKKKGMELRLLHVVAYNQPWFGQWGYKFGRGSFGVTQPVYQKAIEAIQSMPLSLLIQHLANFNQFIPLIFSRYQTFSDNSLGTLGDLFHFLLELKSRLPKENCGGSYNPGILVDTTCRWSAKRVEMATRVIVEALKSSESRWVSRQEVRDVARAYIGDTGLLDFVLKSLGNHIVGKYLVRRSLNPVTKVLEYCLEDISNIFPNQDLAFNNSNIKAQYKITGSQLTKDMQTLFKYIFKVDQKQAISSGVLSGIAMASRIILDTKCFVKEYGGEFCSNKVELDMEGKLKVYCTVTLRNNEQANEEMKKTIIQLPYECITLKNNATFDKLKLEVERSFREVYWGLRSFNVESIVNLNAKGSDLVFEFVEVGRKIVFEGSISKERGIMNDEMFENGVRNCVVDCGCGAEDDDGERMISCDICEVWQHSRCVGIPNNEENPPIFLCNRCEQEIVNLPSLP